MQRKSTEGQLQVNIWNVFICIYSSSLLHPPQHSKVWMFLLPSLYIHIYISLETPNIWHDRFPHLSIHIQTGAKLAGFTRSGNHRLGRGWSRLWSWVERLGTHRAMVISPTKKQMAISWKPVAFGPVCQVNFLGAPLFCESTGNLRNQRTDLSHPNHRNHTNHN